MPGIHFEGVNYKTADEMPADVRTRYDKAVRMLPDRDSNGIPDLLEINDAANGPLPFPQAGAGLPAGMPPLPPLPPEAQQAIKLASKGLRWARWVFLGMFALVAACIVLAFLGIIGLIKSSGSYQLALNTATANETIQEVLGAPVHDGLLPSGSTSESGASGSANFSIPLYGSRQSGTLQVTAVKEENTWRLQSMMLEAGGQTYPINP